MRAGTLRHRVQLQENVPTAQNALGETGDGWKTVAHLWASVEPLSGRELFVAKQFNSDATIRVRVRYQAGIAIKSGQRLVHRGRVLQLTSSPIDKEERRRELELMCKEVTG